MKDLLHRPLVLRTDGEVEPGIFNHRACEITAEIIEKELCVLHILIKFGPANIGTMQARTAYDGGNVRPSWQKTYRFRGKIDITMPITQYVSD